MAPKASVDYRSCPTGHDEEEETRREEKRREEKRREEEKREEKRIEEKRREEKKNGEDECTFARSIDHGALKSQDPQHAVKFLTRTK